MSQRVQGSCACGAITISIPQPDNTGLCHCTDCRRASGALCSLNVNVKKPEFKITSGTPKIYQSKADSGGAVRRYFCGECGSQLGNEDERESDVFCVQGGILPLGSLPPPDRALYTKNKESWELSYPSAKEFETQ